MGWDDDGKCDKMMVVVVVVVVVVMNFLNPMRVEEEENMN